MADRDITDAGAARRGFYVAASASHAVGAGDGADFVWTGTGEPHAQRRRAILAEHPEIRALFGHDVRTACVAVACLATQIAMAGLLQAQATQRHWAGSWWFVALVAYGAGAILTHWLAMVIHETSHFLAFRSRRMNRALAVFANLAMVVPIAMTFHRYHLDHHRLLGVDGEDTDLPLAVEVNAIGTHRPRKFFWLLLYFFVYGVRGLTFVKRPNRREIVNAAIVVLADAMILKFIGPTALVYLFLSLAFSHGLHPVAAHYIHEHYAFRDGQETYSYYGPLNLVTFNVGYHVEHHDFMNVPGWRLPALHRIAAQYYRGLLSHRSWTYVLYEFVIRKRFGVGSRIVRTRDAFAVARRPSARGTAALIRPSTAEQLA